MPEDPFGNILKGVGKLVAHAMEGVGKVAEDVGTAAGKTFAEAGNTIGNVASGIGRSVGNAAEKAACGIGETIRSIQGITPEQVLNVVLKAPGTRVNRAEFLYRELLKTAPAEAVRDAIELTPARAGIAISAIDIVADDIIDQETTAVVSLSAAAGFPGGAAVAAMIPADIYQYFTALIRTMQKLAYLYGYPDFELREERISDENLNRVMLFLGVMYGTEGAVETFEKMSETAADGLIQVPELTDKMVRAIGVCIAKQITANSISDLIPIVGAVVSGGVSLATFKPAVLRLKRVLEASQLADPAFFTVKTSEKEANENQKTGRNEQIMNAKELAKYIDHTLLKPDASAEQIKKICDEAKEYGFASVCCNPSRIAFVAEQLAGTDVTPCCVVGFPLGAIPSESKAAETAVAVKNGAREIDMVIDIGAAKDGNWAYVESDIAAVKAACGAVAKLKVIIETCLLTDEEKVEACLAAKRANADFVKTSTGFSKAGATVADVALMRKTVGPEMGVKAAGGVHNRAEALAMIEAGATRIGASSGIAIVTE